MRSSLLAAFCCLLAFGLSAQARVWTDNSGQLEAEARFVSLDGTVANFQLENGQWRQCDLAQLSAEDQQWISLAVAARAFALIPHAEPPRAVAALPARQTSARETAPQTLTSTAGCSSACVAAPQTYECTVMVPQIVTEMRTVTVCEWRTEQREATYTACRMVPETRQVTYEYTVPTYETRQREFVYSVFKPVVSTRQRDFTVMVPHTEKRQGTRRECHMVPVEKSRTVCEDHGSWQQVVQHLGCNCCGSCTRTCNVWVPKYESREVKYTVMRPQVHPVPYEYNVTVCKPEQRTETFQVCNYVPEQKKRSVPYTVCVPVTKTGTREVTSYRRVEEQKTHTYSVCVPYPVEKQVPVQVCRMVAKQVTRPVASCGPASCWCGRRCW